MGLYFVVWGKQKDYKSPLVEEQEIPVKQSRNTGDGSAGSVNSTSNLDVVVTGNYVASVGAVEGMVKSSCIGE